MADDTGVTKHLWNAIARMPLHDLLRIDFFAGLLGLAGGIWAGLMSPARLISAAPVVGTVVGVVLGAVVAGISVQSAFLDQSFLRKIRAIKSDPVDYILPFIFTASIGVIALAGSVILAAMSKDDWRPLLAVIGGVVGLFSFWSIASILPGLGTLIQFIGLRQDALDIPDDES
ncbi:hypothetical protein TPB0596_19780 [Tsukamurella pulmonis]|uniref:hypothetical protein n=1 Tax=Tsukamurella pulmonis TaxID=47312 RepID=UPI001EDEAE47|nr:hypothetical protein [Tsukamurella pulmonis]BDD82215.1 hypothetical protein TPB0596_19780 [Tsukamurella pulmonis]